MATSSENTVEWPNLLQHQYEFCFNLARYPALWGSWGSAKTWALVLRTLVLSTNTTLMGDFSGNVGVLGRQVAKDFRETTLRDLEDLIPPKWITGWNRQEGIMTLIGGSELNFVHFDNFAIGANLGFAAIDQMEEVDEQSFQKLQGRIRRTTLRGTTGPGGRARPLRYRSLFGVGNTNGRASWHFKKWEQNRFNYLEGRKYDPEFWTLPPLTLFDNPYLPRDYVESLRDTLPAKKWRIYALGSWEALEGQILEDYDEEYGVASGQIIPATSWRKYVCIDHGNASGVKYAGFIAIDEDMNSYLYDEVYGDHIQQEEFCKRVKDALYLHEKEMAGNEGRRPQGMEQITLWPCDPSMRRKTEDNASLSIIQAYAQSASRVGFSMPLYAAYAGPGSVDAGNDKLNWLLKNNHPTRVGLPYLKVNSRCHYFRQSAQSYVYDEKTGKPKEGQSDHPVDAVRYNVNTTYVGDFVPQREPDEDLSFAEKVIRDMEDSNHPQDLDDYTQYYSGVAV